MRKNNYKYVTGHTMCTNVICGKNNTNEQGQSYIGAECLKIRRETKQFITKKSTKEKSTQQWKK